MTTSKSVLTRHGEIRNWVINRKGMPAMVRVPDQSGAVRAQLRLRFAQKDKAMQETGLSPCSWTAWLAELDRQQLALRVEPTGSCELVSRAPMN